MFQFAIAQIILYQQPKVFGCRSRIWNQKL